MGDASRWQKQFRWDHLKLEQTQRSKWRMSFQSRRPASVTRRPFFNWISMILAILGASPLASMYFIFQSRGGQVCEKTNFLALSGFWWENLTVGFHLWTCSSHDGWLVLIRLFSEEGKIYHIFRFGLESKGSLYSYGTQESFRFWQLVESGWWLIGKFVQLPLPEAKYVDTACNAIKRFWYYFSNVHTLLHMASFPLCCM